MAYTYALGAVKPWVSDVAKVVGPAFEVANIGGWRATGADMTGHPAGLALDFMVGTDKTKGDAVAAHLVGNASPLKIKYVIWQQRLWQPGKGWSKMEHRSGDRPGYDPNHLRHVHVSFLESVSDGRRLPGPTEEGPGGLPWWIPVPSLHLVDWIRRQLDGTIGDVDVGDIIEDVTGPITTPIDAVRTLMAGETWVRISNVVGGALLALLGIVLLIVSSSDTEKAGALLAAIPHPAAKAAGAVSAVAD